MRSGDQLQFRVNYVFLQCLQRISVIMDSFEVRTSSERKRRRPKKTAIFVSSRCGGLRMHTCMPTVFSSGSMGEQQQPPCRQDQNFFILYTAVHTHDTAHSTFLPEKKRGYLLPAVVSASSKQTQQVGVGKRKVPWQGERSPNLSRSSVRFAWSID